MPLTAIADSPAGQHQGDRDILDQIHDEIVAIRATLGSVLVGSATKDYASLAAGAEDVTGTVTVTGAALGDFVIGSISVDLQGLDLLAYVSAANTVTFNLGNKTAGAVDLGSATLRAFVIPKAAVALAAKVLTK